MATLATYQQNQLKSIPLSRFTEFIVQGDTLAVEKAYNDVGWFRRAQDIRTEAVRTYPYDFRRGDNAIATEKPEDKGKVPAKLDVFDIIDDLSNDLDMYGAAYAIYETNAYGRNGKWRRLYPKSIMPKYDDDTGELSYFERVISTTKKERFEPNELLYLWMPNRQAERGHGKGVSASALIPATALHYVDRFQSAFFEQGALNPTLVNINGYATQPKDEQERIKNVFQRMLSGLKNAFGIHPVDGDVSIHNLMQPLREMSMDVLSNQKREDILSAMGVPHSMVMSNAANMATAQTDRLNFYENTINGQVALIQTQLNERLFSPAGYQLIYMKTRLEVYQQSEVEKAAKLSSLLDRAVTDVKEYREQMDLPPNERLEAIFYQRLESQVSQDANGQGDSDMSEAIGRLELNPTGERNEDTVSDAKAVMVSDIETVRNDLSLWQKKASKRFDEGKQEKAIEFVSEAINPVQHGAIVGALQVAKTSDNVAHIFNEAMRTASMWIDY